MTFKFEYTLYDLINSGVHFGHTSSRWNPQMAPFIYGERNNVHIIDLTKTIKLLEVALEKSYEVGRKGGRILFVGTKKQVSDTVKQAAIDCGQYYVSHRWLGGMLTNWKTIQQSIKKLSSIERKIEDQQDVLTKKELLNLDRQRQKLELALGGIRNMGTTPDLIIVFDAIKDNIAIKEANKLGVPVIAILDTNSPITGVDYIVPGNDDASRAVKFYCHAFSTAIISGVGEQLGVSSQPDNDDKSFEEQMLEQSGEVEVNEVDQPAVATEQPQSDSQSQQQTQQ